MPNKKTDQLLNKATLTLEEAAQLCHFSASELLDKAGSGDLRLCVWIPDHVNIYSVKLIKPLLAAQYLHPDQKGIDYKSTVRYGHDNLMVLSASFEYTKLQPNLNAFIISKESCSQLINGIPAKQCYFEGGFHITVNDEPQEIHPWILSRGPISVIDSRLTKFENNRFIEFVDSDETIVQQDRYFAIFPKQNPNEDPRRYDTQAISLTLNNLFIPASTLADFVDKQSGTLPASIFTPHARTSKALIKIAKAVQIFWSHTNPEFRDNYPRPKEIQIFLMNDSITQIPEYLAKAAARLICPSYAKTGYIPQNANPDDDSIPVYITPQFKDMVKLSEQFWDNSPSPTATNDVVADAFRKTNVVESDVMHAAMLIRPEGTPKGQNRTRPTLNIHDQL